MDKVFEKQSDNSTWIEKQNGLEYARFKFVQEMTGHVLLLDEKRKLYVQLSGVSCYAGSDENALTKLVNSGQWVIHEDEKPKVQNKSKNANASAQQVKKFKSEYTVTFK